MAPRRIGISLGNTKGQAGGVGEYSLQLGLALAAQAPRLRQEHGLELHFHCVQALHGRFGDEVHYLPVKRMQEWVHRAPVHMDLWHGLSQLNRYGPPGGQGLRMVTVLDLNYLYEKTGLSHWRHGWRMRQLLTGQQAVVTITRHVANDVQRELHWNGPLHVVHCGVRDLSTSPQQAVPALQGRDFYFHISRMSPSKNVEALLRMMVGWPERLLVLAGPSAERNAELQAQAAALGLNNVQVLTGVNDAQKTWLYAHCTAFFFPSITEGFGLPPLEAMHFGKPAFLSDRTSLPEVGGEAAHYWTNFDAAAMRAVVDAGLAGHDAARAQAVRLQAQRFTWEAAAQAHIGLYLGLLGDAGLAAAGTDSV